MKHRNAQTQYFVTKGHMKHLEYKIFQGASAEEIARFRNVMIPFLDTLADLMNNPEIAKQWDDDHTNQVAQEYQQSAEDVQILYKKMQKDSALEMKLVLGALMFAWAVASAFYVYGLLHK
jgi:hypothetical protein